MDEAKRILVIEDEMDVLKMTVFRLKKAGYDVLTADDGKKGLETVEQERPDFIFLDLNLPVMDGYEVCRELKKDEELKKIPVVILSASSDGIKEKSIEIGADDYIIKPYEPQELLNKIEKFLG